MNYKEDKVSGYQRCYGGTFSNPKDGTPSITFNEEVHIDVDGQMFSRQLGSISVELIDPNKPLLLINPVDNTPISVEMFLGKIQAQNAVIYEDMFIYLYSLYHQVAIERDATSLEPVQ